MDKTKHSPVARARALDAALALCVVALDRLSKRAVSAALEPDAPKTLIDGVLGLRLSRNTGAAFGLFADNGWALTALTALILIGVAVAYLRKPHANAWLRVGMAAVLAGGLSNLFDRITMGYVIDFIEVLLFRFAIFNVADIAVVAGTVAMAVGLLRSEG